MKKSNLLKFAKMGKMKKSNLLKVMRIVSLGLTVLEMIVSGWVDSKEMESMVEEYVKERRNG